MHVYVCLFFLLSNSTLFLITEQGGEGEAVELILWEEEKKPEGTTKEQMKT